MAILDENGDVLGQSLGLPLFLGNLEICVKLAAEMFGWEAFAPGRRLLHERLVHDRHPPERRHGLRAGVLAGAAGRLLGDSGPLARRRRQGRGWPDGLARDLPGGDALGSDAALRRRGAARGHHRPAAPQRPLRLLAGRRHERPGGRLPDRRGALPGDPRPVRLRDLPGGAGGDLPAVRAAGARGGGGDPRRQLRGQRLPGQRRPRPRPDPGRASPRRRRRPDDDRPGGVVASDGGAGQLRLRPDGVGLPGRVQAPDQPRASRRRRHLPHPRGQGAPRARSSTPRSPPPASGTSAPSGS